MIDPNSIPVDQSLSSLGSFLGWFSFVIVGTILIGLAILVKATEPIITVLEDESPILEPKAALVAHKKPTYPEDDTVIINEEIEEEPFIGTPI